MIIFSFTIYKIVLMYRLIFRPFLDCWFVNFWFLRSLWKPMLLMPALLLLTMLGCSSKVKQKKCCWRIKNYVWWNFWILLWYLKTGFEFVCKKVWVNWICKFSAMWLFPHFSAVIWMLISDNLRYQKDIV